MLDATGLPRGSAVRCNTVAIYSIVQKGKRKRSDSVLWQKPLHQHKCQKGKSTTQTTPQKSSVTQRLRTDWGRSVGVTTATQLVMLTWFTDPTFPLPPMFYSEGGSFSNKLLWHCYVKEHLRSYLRKFSYRYGDLTKQNEPRIPNVTRHSGWWPSTVTSSIDQAFHKFLTLLLIWALLPDLIFFSHCERFP